MPQEQPQADRDECEVGQHGPVGLQVLEQTHPDDREAGGNGPHGLLVAVELDQQDRVGGEVQVGDPLFEIGLQLGHEDGVLLE